MDSILVTTTTTMRITVAVNLQVILLALAVGAVALPNISSSPGIKDKFYKSPSHFSFSFSLHLPPFFAQLVDS